MTESATIRFYEPKKPFYEFSNFFETSFELDGTKWTTTEHYFQASKFRQNPDYVEVIRVASTPNKAFILGQQKKKGGYAGKWPLDPKKDKRSLNDLIDSFKECKIIEDWDQVVKIEVMEKAVMAKFSQNEKLRALLISTGDAEIVEDSPRDSFWGIGKDGNGQNMLGKILMKIRTLL